MLPQSIARWSEQFVYALLACLLLAFSLMIFRLIEVAIFLPLQKQAEKKNQPETQRIGAKLKTEAVSLWLRELEAVRIVIHRAGSL